jgi:hypothetical protein
MYATQMQQKAGSSRCTKLSTRIQDVTSKKTYTRVLVMWCKITVETSLSENGMYQTLINIEFLCINSEDICQ